MAPKKKAQKMGLADFFADTTSGSWADEMVNIPTAPAGRDAGAAPKRGEPGYLDAMPDRGSIRPAFSDMGPPREELPVPDVPPFTAFVGNLVFEVDEDALRDFFAAESPISVRLVKDPTGRPKGFGYVEFGSKEGLQAALGKTMSQMMGRTIRISVADAPAKRDGYPGSAADGADQWRRTTPLPAREAPQPARRTSSFADREPSGPDLDWGAARGSRFVPSAPHSPSGLRRDSSGPGRERDLGPSAADDAGQWRSSRPMAEPRGSREGSLSARGGIRTGDSSPSMAETETTWSRGSKLKTPVVDEAPSSVPSPGDDRDWRSSRATSAVPSADGGSPRQPPAPLERRKLALAPRSVPPTPAAAQPAEASPTDSKGIFGSAKPIDSAAKERLAEEKLKQREEDRRKAREEEIKKQKEEEEKGRLLQEEKLKKFKEEQAKATAAAFAAQGLPPTPTKETSTAAGAGAGAQANGPAARGQPAGRGRGGPPTRGAWGHGGPAPGQGPRRTSSGGPHPPTNPDGSRPRPSGPTTQGTAPPTNAWGGAGAGRRRSSQEQHAHSNSNPNSANSERRNARSPPVVSEDGFEGVPKGRGARGEAKDAAVPTLAPPVGGGAGGRPTVTRKESATRPGFSFAAAANSFGLLDEDAEAGEGDDANANANADAGKVNGNGSGGAQVNGGDVEGVTKAVEEVKV